VGEAPVGEVGPGVVSHYRVTVGKHAPDPTSGHSAEPTECWLAEQIIRFAELFFRAAVRLAVQRRESRR
jgi:hypothetical protein